MITTYRLHVNELSVDLVKSIQAAFNGKQVEITVTDSMDETDYLLGNEANRKNLEKSMQQAAGNELVTFSVQEFEEKYGKK